jgi:hypothetical protein
MSNSYVVLKDSQYGYLRDDNAPYGGVRLHWTSSLRRAGKFSPEEASTLASQYGAETVQIIYNEGKWIVG